MISAIRSLMKDCDGSIEQVIASTYASLAYTYRRTVEQIEEVTGKDYPCIYIVGGGSQNHYLNQLTADLTGKEVVSGPKEATSLGNIGVQLVAHIDGLQPGRYKRNGEEFRRDLILPAQLTKGCSVDRKSIRGVCGNIVVLIVKHAHFMWFLAALFLD